MSKFNEDIIEQAAVEWLRELSYKTLLGEIIARGEPAAELASGPMKPLQMLADLL